MTNHPPATEAAATTEATVSSEAFEIPIKANVQSTAIPHEEAPSNANTSISNSEVNYILAGCTANFRVDGRSNLDHRPYSLSSSNTSQSSPLLLSNGSSRISLPGSTTDILCSIKAELIHPSPLHPNEGVVDLNLDLLPYSAVTSSSNSNDRRTARNLEMEVASVLSHLLLPHVVHRPSLVVIKGRYVWRLNVDVLVLHCDGNLLDNCSLAIRGAVRDLSLPRVVPVAVDQHQHQDRTTHGQLPGAAGKNNVSNDIMLDSDVAHSIRPNGAEECPIVVTVSLLPKFTADEMGSIPQQRQPTSQDSDHGGGGSAIHKVKKRNDTIMLVDASRQEEACASTRVSVSVDPSGRICGVHKYGSSSSTASLTGGGGGTMPFGMLAKVGNVAIATSIKINKSFQDEEAAMGKDCGYNNVSTQYSDLLRGNFELR